VNPTLRHRRRLTLAPLLALALLLLVLPLPSAHAATSQDHGMTLWGWTPTAYAEPASDAALGHIKAIGATSVTLVPMWFQATAGSSAMAPRADVTTSDASLEHAVRQAKARGLRVVIKPQIDVVDGSWRGAISPAQRDAWFAAYGRFVRHYATLGQRLGASQVVVGTELFGVSGDTSRWVGVIRQVRSVFGGRLTYAALPFEYSRIGFWSSLDSVGVDAYWKLSSTATTDVQALRLAWSPILRELQQFSARVNRPIQLTEAGYASQVGTATNPSGWDLSSTPAPAEQSAAYQALLSSFSARSWCSGITWWAWRATDDSAPLDFTPEGKPAEQVLRSWWGS
jgi:hypothetical protein